MRPDLLALLTPEQQEVWRIHGIASYMPSAYVADALLQLAQAKEAIIIAPEIRQKLHDAQKFAAGLELNLAAVIQRAEAAEKALADAKSRLLDAQAARTIWMERSKANAAEYNVAYDAMCEIAQMLDCAEDWAAIKGKLAEAQKEEKAS